MACQSCEGCNSCDSCQWCHGCNNCDTCQNCDNKCDGPAEGCLTCQGFCEKSQSVSSRLGGFGWGVSTATDAFFFSRNTWNSIINYINNARADGSKQSSGLSLLGQDTNEFMTAAKFNEVSNAIFNQGTSSSYGQITVTGGPEGSIVYGSYFTALADQASKLKYIYGQCDLCNTKCDDCDKCQGCNLCESSDWSNGVCTSGNSSSDCCESLKPSE